MVHATSFMKKTLLSLSIASLSVLSNHVVAEQASLKKTYQEPTRGFFLEHGMVAPAGKASVELHSGSDEFSSGGGIRLGLSNAELLLNTGINEYDENALLVKWGLPTQNQDGSKKTPLIWSGLLGIGHTNIEDENHNHDEQLSFTFGIAATVKADAAVFTVSPKLVYKNSDNADDDTFFELDLGGYVGLIETDSGLFSVGAEALITTEDNIDNSFALGGRWLYNERINIDIVPLVFSDNNFSGIPGLVRLNIAF